MNWITPLFSPQRLDPASSLLLTAGPTPAASMSLGQLTPALFSLTRRVGDLGQKMLCAGLGLSIWAISRSDLYPKLSFMTAIIASGLEQAYRNCTYVPLVTPNETLQFQYDYSSYRYRFNFILTLLSLAFICEDGRNITSLLSFIGKPLSPSLRSLLSPMLLGLGAIGYFKVTYMSVRYISSKVDSLYSSALFEHRDEFVPRSGSPLFVEVEEVDQRDLEPVPCETPTSAQKETIIHAHPLSEGRNRPTLQLGNPSHHVEQSPQQLQGSTQKISFAKFFQMHIDTLRRPQEELQAYVLAARIYTSATFLLGSFALGSPHFGANLLLLTLSSLIDFTTLAEMFSHYWIRFRISPIDKEEILSEQQLWKDIDYFNLYACIEPHQLLNESTHTWGLWRMPRKSVTNARCGICSRCVDDDHRTCKSSNNLNYDQATPLPYEVFHLDCLRTHLASSVSEMVNSYFEYQENASISISPAVEPNEKKALIKKFPYKFSSHFLRYLDPDDPENTKRDLPVPCIFEYSQDKKIFRAQLIF